MSKPNMRMRHAVEFLVVVLLLLAKPSNGTLPMINPCRGSKPSLANLPFCNASLPIDARIQSIISMLSVSDKIGLMGQDGPDLPKLGLNGYHWWSEATHGVSPARNDVRTPYESNFAFPITTSMSFNRSLWRQTAEQIGRESRAFANAGNGFNTFWTPVVNLAREPRWGRNIETPGEDPLLSSEYAVHFTKGFQEAPEDPEHIMASACCKHYVGNEMEHSREAGFESDREEFDATISMQDLADSYMIPFQACVERGGVTSLMCSYNSINGVPSCANNWLLTDIARNAWGFDGAIVSDCDADSDVYNRHHYTKTPEEAVRDILRAGTDVDCGGFVTDHAESALKNGMITEQDLDIRLYYQFRLRMRLGHFDPAGPLDDIPPSAICSDRAKALVREGVIQSAVLLKNSQSTLPLSAGNIDNITVISPLNNKESRERLLSYYGGDQPCDKKMWGLADGIREHVHEVHDFLGVPSVTASQDPDPDAIEAARQADRVIVGIGTDLSLAREGFDATTIELSASQHKLVNAVAQVSKHPILVIIFSATPLDISAILHNPNVGAVVHVGQPSVAVVGLGDVLFGKRAPAGRLVQTVYPAAYTGQVSIFDFNMRPGPSAWPRPDCKPEGGNYSHCPKGTNPGRTHRFYTGIPVLPFGYGLSYTRFKYEFTSSQSSVSLKGVQKAIRDAGSHPTISHKVFSGLAPLISFSVRVTNVGEVDSDDVVLGFLKPPGAGVNGVPLQSLFGFERVHVKAGENVSVTLYPSHMEFLQATPDGTWTVWPGQYTVQFGTLESRAHGMGFATGFLDVSDPDLIYL